VYLSGDYIARPAMKSRRIARDSTRDARAAFQKVEPILLFVKGDYAATSGR
jgi:hypothetical protein